MFQQRYVKRHEIRHEPATRNSGEKCVRIIPSRYRTRPEGFGPPLFWKVSFQTSTGPSQARHFGTRKLHWRFMQRSSKGSSQDNSSFRFRKRLWSFPGPSLSNDIIFSGPAVTIETSFGKFGESQANKARSENPVKLPV
jgi:hypothetical protein